MIHNVNKEQYIKNPCGSSSIAYWKNIEYNKPHNIEIIHERDFLGAADSSKIIKYFRLFHDLKDIALPVNDDFFVQNVNIKTQSGLIADILSKCYNVQYSTEFIESLTKHRAFNDELWIFAIEKITMCPVALGIADYDEKIREGSLEWIQVLPDKRMQGLGELVVRELLFRLKSRADFVTVSGEVDNLTKPDLLYRKCGFTGDDIWCVICSE